MQKNTTISFILNADNVSTSHPPGAVVLDYLRQQERLTGTKEGCREGDCGACLILLGRLQDGQIQYKPVNSCLLPLGDIAGAHIVTIEGLNSDSLNPIQQAFVDEGASQCGFCTPGMIVALTAFFLNCGEFTSTAAISALDGNICRCTGYMPIKKAAERLAAGVTGDAPPANSQQRLKFLIDRHVLPPYFSDIMLRLQPIHKKLNGEMTKPSGHFVAGGTDLFVQRPEDLLDAKLAFLSRRKDLSRIWSDDDFIYLGAAVTVELMHTSPLLRHIFPNINAYMKLVSSTPIRSRATIGGNIVNASPIGDLSIFFLALNASLLLVKESNRRLVLLKDFFLEYKKIVLQENELIERLQFLKPKRGFHFNFDKVSKRTFLDIAGVNSALCLEMDGDIIKNIGLSAGGVAPIPLVLKRTIDFMCGAKISPHIVKEAAEIAQNETSPISDVRGSADYKRLLLRQLIFSHFVTLFPNQFTPEALL